MTGYGAYGKMPSLGDFFRIDLPRSFCEPWDKWLQAILSNGRTALGARWQTCYMSAPIWRFSLAAGLAGPQAMSGVMMPSVDRVGRAFPLTLAGPLQADADTFALLEEIALAALEDDMTKDRLVQCLRQVSGGGTVGPPCAVWQALQAGGDIFTFTTADLPSGPEALSLFDLSATEVSS